MGFLPAVPLTVAATAKSSAAPINGMSIKVAVPALTTDVRYRDCPYAAYWGYPTYYYYGYPTTSSVTFAQNQTSRLLPVR